MKTQTQRLVRSLREISGRLLQAGEIRKQIADGHRLARQGYRGQGGGRAWNAMVIANVAGE